MTSSIPGCQLKASTHFERTEGAGKVPCPGSAIDQDFQEGDTAQVGGHGGEVGFAGAMKKVGILLRQANQGSQRRNMVKLIS